MTNQLPLFETMQGEQIEKLKNTNKELNNHLDAVIDELVDIKRIIIGLSNSLTSLTNDVREDNPDSDALTLMYVDKHLQLIIDKLTSE